MADESVPLNSEIRRLREELSAARKRLEAEESRFQARLESQRTRLEADALRQQAAEVSRRRQLEQEITALHERLAASGDGGAATQEERQQRRDELERELVVSQKNAASLEEELLLTRQALNLSERARAAARSRALRLATVLRELRHQIEAGSKPDRFPAGRHFDGRRLGHGDVNEIDMDRANAVLREVERALDRQDADDDETDGDGDIAGRRTDWMHQFLDFPGDESFERRRREREQAREREQEEASSGGAPQPVSTAEPVMPSRAAVEPPPQPRVPASRPKRQGVLGRLLRGWPFRR